MQKLADISVFDSLMGFSGNADLSVFNGVATTSFSFTDQNTNKRTLHLRFTTKDNSVISVYGSFKGKSFKPYSSAGPNLQDALTKSKAFDLETAFEHWFKKTGSKHFKDSKDMSDEQLAQALNMVAKYEGIDFDFEPGTVEAGEVKSEKKESKEKSAPKGKERPGFKDSPDYTPSGKAGVMATGLWTPKGESTTYILRIGYNKRGLPVVEQRDGTGQNPKKIDPSAVLGQNATMYETTPGLMESKDDDFIVRVARAKNMLGGKCTWLAGNRKISDLVTQRDYDDELHKAPPEPKTGLLRKLGKLIW